LGLDDVLNSDALVLVEWGERFPQVFRRERFESVLTITGETSRLIECSQKTALADFARVI
jgi:tRNA threonylcarbamoyladenosine biosynthesis protein TsaE